LGAIGPRGGYVEPQRVEVRTLAGSVRGRVEDGVAVFRGIPFAAAPVGALRFQAPVPVPAWDGIREADVFGPPPPQARLRPPPPPLVGPVRHDPTDWLTVNVWTADPGAAGLAVMVWVHGGAYRFGTASDPDWDGSPLARSGVVVVTANHRIGVEGYLHLDGAPANRGLLDIVATLRWVQENIAGFGGDPAKVTVFGESAGAGAIASLLVMPAAAGLFGRAVAQSVPGTFFTPALARDIAAELVAPLGVSPEAAALAAFDPRELVAAVEQLDPRMPSYERWGVVAHTPTPFSPVVDGDVLPTDPWTGLAAGAARGIPLLTGHNRDEWRLFLVMGGLPGAITEDIATHTMQAFAPDTPDIPDTPDADRVDAASRMRAAYPTATPEDLYVLARSDRMFRMPSLHLAAAQHAGGGRAHLYELTWPTPAANGAFGACHGLDIPLVLGTMDKGLAGILLDSPPPAEAVEISAQMHTAWTAFARTGDPGWPPYTEPDRLTMVFDTKDRGGLTSYPEESSRRLWSHTRFGAIDLRG
jgi:para-nitrobenzyl esterase